MENIKRFLKNFAQDESAQGATEYILLLVVVVGIAMLFKNQIKQLLEDKISQLGSQISSFE